MSLPFGEHLRAGRQVGEQEGARGVEGRGGEERRIQEGRRRVRRGKVTALPSCIKTLVMHTNKY